MLVVVHKLASEFGHGDGPEGQERGRGLRQLGIDLGGDLPGLTPAPPALV